MARRRWSEGQSIPTFGEIKGGRLDSWRYGLRRMVIDQRGHAEVLAYCTPPHWPFGREIVCTWSLAHRFVAVPGERAPRLAVQPMINAAMRVAGGSP